MKKVVCMLVFICLLFCFIGCGADRASGNAVAVGTGEESKMGYNAFGVGIRTIAEG